MGKSKNKKFKSSRPKPSGLRSVKEFEAELPQLTVISVDDHEFDETPSSVLEQTQKSNVQTIVDKLGSPEEEDRECGCIAIANLIPQPGAIPHLMQHNVVKIVAPLMLDPGTQVRHRAIGALRNLSVDGGTDVCEEMIRNDVMTPLVALFQQYGNNWQPDKMGKNLTVEIFIEAVHLLWNLCENSEIAISVFNRENLLNCVWPCLQAGVYGFPLANTVARCLHTVTEENPEAAAVCQTTDMAPLLESLMMGPAETSDQVLLRTLASGILVNVSCGQLSSATGSVVTTITKTVADVLAMDAAALLNMVVNEIMQANAERSDRIANGLDTKHIVTEDDSGLIEKKMKDIENMLCAQQVAMEIVANLCCADDDEWEDVSSSESSSDLSGDIEMEDVDGSTEVSPLCVSAEVGTAIAENEIVSKVVLKTHPVDLNILQTLGKSPEITLIQKSFLRLQVRGLFCLNNLMNAMKPEALGGSENLDSIWVNLVQLTTSQEALQDRELLEAATAALRATVHKLAELNSEKFSQITLRDIQFILEMGQHCQYKEVRVDAIRILSTIGSLLAKVQEPHPLLKNIGLFLLEIACKDSELCVVAEAVDSIFDVFGEDHVDPVLKEIGLVDKLKLLLPALKSKINSSKNALGEHYPVISMALTNLIRFIKYKSQK